MTNPHQPHDDSQRPAPFLDISPSGKIRNKKRRRSAQDYQATLESQRQRSPQAVNGSPVVNSPETAHQHINTHNFSGHKIARSQPPQHFRAPSQHPYLPGDPGDGPIPDQPRRRTRQPEQWASRPNVKHEWASVLWGLVVAIVIFGLVIAGFEMRRTDRQPASEKDDKTEQSQDGDDSEILGLGDMQQETFDENFEAAQPADEPQTVNGWEISVHKVTTDMATYFDENDYADHPFDDNIALIVEAKNTTDSTDDFLAAIGISDEELEFPFDGLCTETPKNYVSPRNVPPGDKIAFTTCIPVTVDDLEGATLWAGASYSDENRVSWELPDGLLDEIADELDDDVDKAKK